MDESGIVAANQRKVKHLGEYMARNSLGRSTIVREAPLLVLMAGLPARDQVVDVFGGPSSNIVDLLVGTTANAAEAKSV